MAKNSVLHCPPSFGWVLVSLIFHFLQTFAFFLQFLQFCNTGWGIGLYLEKPRWLYCVSVLMCFCIWPALTQAPLLRHCHRSLADEKQNGVLVPTCTVPALVDVIQKTPQTRIFVMLLVAKINIYRIPLVGFWTSWLWYRLSFSVPVTLLFQSFPPVIFFP